MSENRIGAVMSSITLTNKTVETWRAEAASLRAQIAHIERKIAAAEVLLTDVDDAAHHVEKTRSSDAGSDMSLVDAILRVLQDMGGGPLSNDEIKDLLPTVGFDINSMHRNYYYTATKRLSDRGSVRKNEDGTYSLPKENEPPKGGSEAEEIAASSEAHEQGKDGDLLGYHS
ncbi:hypothetical protein SSE37_18892 [Sagittula stellata E-37]|nr:hypothetical protein SSE37_18892 [Sagittula stellata E-37]